MLLAATQLAISFAAAPAATISVTYAAAAGANVTGRAFIFLSTEHGTEPRSLVGDDISTQQVFGVDVVGLSNGAHATVDVSTLGYPVLSLEQVPDGEYTLQAVIQPYHLYHLKGAPAVWLPRTEVNRFEGGDIFTSPGTFYSKPVKANFSSASQIASMSLRLSIEKTSIRSLAESTTSCACLTAVTWKG